MTNVTSIDTGDTLLTRAQAAAALTAGGYPIAGPTLATLVTRGGGPTYRLFGSRALYRHADLFAWAAGRMSAPRFNSSQAA